MSMPDISGSDVLREQSVTDIIESVAREQAALSHILNAEGEKLQAFTSMPGVTPALRLTANKSVKNMVDTIAKLEMHLQTKLNLFGDALLPISLRFYKRDSVTGIGVGGAIFTLSQDSIPVCTATSSAGGRVSFTCLAEGMYSLAETVPAEGYKPNTATYTVVVIDRDTITINGAPASDFVVLNEPYSDLTVLKIEDFDIPQANATFELADVDGVSRNTTGADGLAVFPRVVPGTYTLKEVAWPAGFLPDLTEREVVVDDAGVMTIDGVATNSTTFQNHAATGLDIAFSFLDDRDEHGMRPETFMLNVYQNGILHSSEPTMAAPSGFVQIHNLRRYDDNDVPYIYTFDGSPVAHYSEQVIGNRIIYLLVDYDLSGTVVWVDNDDAGGLRPAQVTVRLLQDNIEIDDIVVTAANNWKFTFANQPVNHTYKLQQDAIADYTTSYTGNNVVNTLAV